MSSLRRKSIRLSGFVSSILPGITLVFPLGLLAAEQPDQAAIPPGILAKLDAPRDYVSERIVGFATDMDRFFGDERNFQESNKSVLQINLSKVAGYNGERNLVLSGKAKLHLPSTEKRLHLLLETDSEKNITGDVAQGQPVVLDKVTAPEKLSLAARYEKQEEVRWHLSADAGIQVRRPLEPFVRTRGSYSFPFETWRTKLAESVFWFNTIGAGETTQLDLERLISEPVMFRASSNATWLHDKQNFDLRQDLSFYQTLNERSALMYQASAIGVSNPQVQVTEYAMVMLYRYRLHRDWIFIELSPQLHFPKADNFKSNPSLSMRMEMLFDKSR